MFPRAKFIHMVRDPRKLYASTLRLWKSLSDVQGMQTLGDDAQLRAFIWNCLDRMYKSFEAARAGVPAGALIDIRYEDLVAAPKPRWNASMQSLIRRLQPSSLTCVTALCQ